MLENEHHFKCQLNCQLMTKNLTIRDSRLSNIKQISKVKYNYNLLFVYSFNILKWIFQITDICIYIVLLTRKHFQ